MSHFQTRLPNNSHLPRRIERLHELAYNLWWTWNPEAERLFKLIDSDLWEGVYHNPALTSWRNNPLTLICLSTSG